MSSVTVYISELSKTAMIALPLEAIELVYDVLRYGREEFFDENGFQLSIEETDKLQEVIDALEPAIGGHG